MARREAGPSLSEEIRGWRSGQRHIAGVDEVGRGPMAGPVVAAAVILDPQFAGLWWSELRDSKTLTALQRTRLAARLRDEAAFGIGAAGHEEIDERGIVPATRLAMLRALEQLPRTPQLVLVDAMTLPDEVGPQLALIHGDARCVSIAAASIVAKVERDGMMDEFDRSYPQYGFGHNRGYCTPDHLRVLQEHGPCPIHRRSFAPVREYLERMT